MFKKILVANRGEIACRVLQSAQRLGVATVAVYSEADAKARHVRMADEAFCIGAAPVSESYLQIERVLDVMRKTGAEAVHPGYGLCPKTLPLPVPSNRRDECSSDRKHRVSRRWAQRLVLVRPLSRRRQCSPVLHCYLLTMTRLRHGVSESAFLC